MGNRIAVAHEIIDPYSGKDMGFADEAQAYACFMENRKAILIIGTG